MCPTRITPTITSQGFELDTEVASGLLKFSVHYTWLDARYVSGFSESSPANSDSRHLFQA